MNVFKKTKEHYNENWFYYWVFSMLLPLLLYLGNKLISAIISFTITYSSYLSELFYSKIWIINSIMWWIVIILLIIMIILFLFIRIKLLNEISLNVLDYIQVLIMLIFIWIIFSLSDKKEDINSRLIILKPFLQETEIQDFHVLIYNLQSNDDYNYLINSLDIKIEKYIWIENKAQ